MIDIKPESAADENDLKDI